jgi:hypothetical protein
VISYWPIHFGLIQLRIVQTLPRAPRATFFESQNLDQNPTYYMMRFREFVFNEEPMDMGGGAPPMGGDPMGGAPPMGGDPMGGGMGMDPMGGGMAPPMGGGEQEPPPVPIFADVWDVLDSILNQKPLEQEELLAQQQQQQAEQPPADPMAGGMPPPPGGDPMAGGMPPGDPMGGAGAAPMGAPAPHLMG